MTQQEMTQLLIKNHSAFVQKLEALPITEFERQPGNKWTAGQQLDHILKSVVPVAKAFNTPTTVLGAKFGLSKTVSRNYDELVSSYLQTLEDLKDFTLPERFAPATLKAVDRPSKTTELMKAVAFLNDGINHLEEGVLDSHTILHPAMGKLTLREMVYFTIYHVTHHDKQVLDNLKANPL